MRRVKEVIVVEGKYDTIRVKSAVEALVVETGGFALFRNPEKRELIRRLAAERGVILLTDSDGAGFVIRDHLTGFIPAEQIRQAYIPPLPGKERRKTAPSREGLLGVEGVDSAVVLQALERAGATFEDMAVPPVQKMHLTKADLFDLGLSGTPDSATRRRELLQRLSLPANLSANRLLEVLNATVTAEQLQQLLEK